MVSDFIFHLRDNLAYLRDVKTTNKIVMEHFLVVYYGASQLSLVFSRYTHSPSNPLSPVTSLGLCSISDVITFGQNWYHLWLRSAGIKDLFNDIQIRVIGSMEPEKCTKMLKNVKNAEQNSLRLQILHGKNCPSR